MIDEKKITPGSILDCVYCKRRYYLRSIEQREHTNVYMELGKEEHESVDKSSITYNDGKYIVTNMAVYSSKYELYGICDEVIFEESDDGVDVDMLNIRAMIYPVEFKHGKVRHCNEYISQVVAQALCLEEMFHCSIKKGCIYFVDADEYFDFDISEPYRKIVYDAIEFIIKYNGYPIKPQYSRRCKGCALFDVCAPKKLAIENYMKELWE